MRPARTWTLRNHRGDVGAPLAHHERFIHPDADVYRLIAAIVAQALEDLDAGYATAGTASERYVRAQAYLWFFHGQPTGFERFARRFGIDARGLFPPHALFDDVEALRERRADLPGLGLPPDLFDRHIAALVANGIAPGEVGRIKREDIA